MPPKTLNLCLMISLLLNAFLAGFVISHMSSHHDFAHHMPGGLGPRGFMVAALDTLPPDSRVRIEAILEKHKEDKPAPRDMGKFFGTLRGELTSQTFDYKRFSALEKTLHQNEGQMHANLSRMIEEIAGTLNDQERVAFFAKAFPPPPDDFSFEKDK